MAQVKLDIDWFPSCKFRCFMVKTYDRCQIAASVGGVIAQ